MAEKERFELYKNSLVKRVLWGYNRIVTEKVLLRYRFIEQICGGGELFFTELGIDVHGGGDLFMTEDLLDGFRVEVGFKCDGGEAMAELVGGGCDSCLFFIIIVEGYEAAAGKRRFTVVTYYILVRFFSAREQLGPQSCKQRDDSITCFGLWCFNHGTVSVVGYGLCDVYIVFIEIYILPFERKYLSFSHTRHEGKEWEEPEVHVALDNLLVRAACRLTRRFWQVRWGLYRGAGVQIYIAFHYGVIEDPVYHHAVIADHLLGIALSGESIEIFLNIFCGDVLCGGIVEEGDCAAHSQFVGTDRLEGKLRLGFFPPFVGYLAEASADLCFLRIEHYFFIDLALGLAVKIDALMSAGVYDGAAEATVGAD